MMEISSEDIKIIEQLEQELWCPKTRFNLPYMQEILATDFVEFGKSGRIYQRQDTLDIAYQAIEIVFPLPEFQVRLLAENIAQVTYNSVVTHHGAIESARRSSIWSRTATGWILRFHQGTPFQA